MKHTLYFLGILLLMSATSCVSNKKYREAQARISALQGDSSSLEGRLAQRRAELDQMEARLRQLQASNSFTSSQLNMSQDEIARQRTRLEQLQARIDEQRRATEELRSRMAAALVNFSSDQLSVSVKNGKVYVSLQESLLFPSGSATVNPKGREALATIATALNQTPDINVLVEGHTDSIPITKRYEDNWALSVARSTAIARILMTDYSVSPTRITASGRSQYEPVETNSTPEGRARNRRTEIILEPNLKELMDLLNAPATAPSPPTPQPER